MSICLQILNTEVTTVKKRKFQFRKYKKALALTRDLTKEDYLRTQSAKCEEFIVV